MFDLDTHRLRTLLKPAREQRVRSAAFDFDYYRGDLVEGALRVAHVLLFQNPRQEKTRPTIPNVTDTPFERWIEHKVGLNLYHAHILSNWITVARDDFGHYPIFLYNRNFGQVRRILKSALTWDAEPPPYLFLLFMNAFRQAMGLSYDQIAALALDGPMFHATASLLNDLFVGNRMLEWFRRKRQPLRFYAGSTNTVLGRYDPIFTDSDTGIQWFNIDAQARYDIGGGFATSEIERLTGRSFISADLISPDPTQYDPELCIQVRLPDGCRRVADDSTREAFLVRQRKVRHLCFDVLNDSLPANGESCAVVSAGFMTSTVRPATKTSGAHVPGAGLAHLLLSLHAVIRVLELVQKSKSVDLFTIQRATGRVYKYRTVLIQWRNGRLSRLVTTDDPKQNRWTPQALTSIFRKINPAYRPYLQLLP
jgi:hypothetical protein